MESSSTFCSRRKSVRRATTLAFLGLLALAATAFSESLNGLIVRTSPHQLIRINLATGDERILGPILSVPDELQHVGNIALAPNGFLYAIWFLADGHDRVNHLLRIDPATGLAQSLGLLGEGHWLLEFGPDDRLWGLQTIGAVTSNPEETLFEVDPETAVLSPWLGVLPANSLSHALVHAGDALYRVVSGTNHILEKFDTQTGMISGVVTDVDFHIDTAAGDQNGSIIWLEYFAPPITPTPGRTVTVGRLDPVTGATEEIATWSTLPFSDVTAIGQGPITEVPTTSRTGLFLLGALLTGYGFVALRRSS